MAKKGLLNQRLAEIERRDRTDEITSSEPQVFVDLDSGRYDSNPQPYEPQPAKHKRSKRFKTKKIEVVEYDGGNMLRENQRDYSEFHDVQEYEHEFEQSAPRYQVASSILKEPVNAPVDVNDFVPEPELPVIEQKKTFKEKKTRVTFAIKHWFTPLHTAVVAVAIILLFIAVGQLPTLIYNTLDTSGEFVVEVNSDTINIQKELLELQASEDWDNDGILNLNDASPYDPDADANGVIDGDANSLPISRAITFNYQDVLLVTDNPNASVTKFLDYYAFTNYKGWVKFQGRTGEVYISKDGINWEPAVTQAEGEDTYVYITGTCYLEILLKPTYTITQIKWFGINFEYCNKDGEEHNVGFMKGVFDFIFGVFFPKDNGANIQYKNIRKTTEYQKGKGDTLAPAVIGQYNLTSERFSTINNSIKDIEGVYSLIREDHTVLCSVQSQEFGEALLLIYGYDDVGNLYVMDSATNQIAGVIRIIPTSRIISSSNAYVVKDWYEFNGLGFNSTNGDRIVFLEME